MADTKDKVGKVAAGRDSVSETSSGEEDSCLLHPSTHSSEVRSVQSIDLKRWMWCQSAAVGC